MADSAEIGLIVEDLRTVTKTLDEFCAGVECTIVRLSSTDGKGLRTPLKATIAFKKLEHDDGIIAINPKGFWEFEGELRLEGSSTVLTIVGSLHEHQVLHQPDPADPPIWGYGTYQTPIKN